MRLGVLLAAVTMAVATPASSLGRPLQLKRAKLLYSNGYVLTSGDHVLEVRNGQTTSLLLGVGGRSTAIHGPAGCTPKALGPADIAYQCTNVGGPPELILHIASGQIVPVGTPGMPVRVGSRWAEFDVVESEPHSVSSAFYVDLRTGATRSESVSAGRRVYPNLNSPSLTALACSPVTVRAFNDPDVHRPVAGRLQFFGRVAVSTALNRSGRLVAQRCHSSKTARFRFVFHLVSSATSIAWSPNVALIKILQLRTGKVFELDASRLQPRSDPILEGMTSTTIYASQDGSGVYAIPLPAAVTGR